MPIQHWFEHLSNVFGAVLSAGGNVFLDVLKSALTFFSGIVEGLIGFLPDMPDLGLEPVTGWVHGYTYVNTFLPVSEALVVAGMYLIVSNAAFIWNLGVKAYHLLPKPGMGT